MKEDLRIKYIYDKYYNKAYLFVLSYINDKDVADGIISESIIKLLQKIKQDENADYNIKSFLFSILKNMSLDYLRHLKVQQKALDKLLSIQEKELELRIASLENAVYHGLLVNEIQNIVNATLLKMKSRTQEVFKLSRFERLINKEIAAKLFITEKGVEYHISIALRMLKYDLKDYIYLLLVLPYNYFFN